MLLFCMATNTNSYGIDDVLYEHSHCEFYLDEKLLFFNGNNFSGIAVFGLTLYNSLTFVEKE
jgi:hypothetical protein